jgi:hypothetical protein
MFTLIGSLILIFKELRFRKSEVMNLTEENSFCQIGFFSASRKKIRKELQEKQPFHK